LTSVKGHQKVKCDLILILLNIYSLLVQILKYVCISHHFYHIWIVIIFITMCSSQKFRFFKFSKFMNFGGHLQKIFQSAQTTDYFLCYFGPCIFMRYLWHIWFSLRFWKIANQKMYVFHIFTVVLNMTTRGPPKMGWNEVKGQIKVKFWKLGKGMIIWLQNVLGDICNTWKHLNTNIDNFHDFHPLKTLIFSNYRGSDLHH